jgi:hypothetical protein
MSWLGPEIVQGATGQAGSEDVVDRARRLNWDAGA